MEMPTNIVITSETWVESHPQRMHGFTWRCSLCPEEQRHVYSFEEVEKASAKHMRESHGRRAEWDDIRTGI